MSEATNKSVTLTEREMQTLAAMFRSLKEKPSFTQAAVDTDLFMELSNYKSVASSRNAWNAILKKLAGALPAKSGNGTTETPKKARAKPATSAKTSDAEDDELLDTADAAVPTTPGGAEGDINMTTPATKKSPQKRTAAAAPDGESPTKKRGPRAPKLDEDGNPITPKRAPRKKAVDADGNPILPTPRGRKKKTDDTNGAAAVKKEVLGSGDAAVGDEEILGEDEAMDGAE